MSDLIEIGTLRQSGNGMERLFEAVKSCAASRRTRDRRAGQQSQFLRLKAKSGNTTRPRREKDSEVITFYAETGLE